MADFVYRDPADGTRKEASMSISNDSIAVQGRGYKYVLKGVNGDAASYLQEPGIEDDLVMGNVGRGRNNCPMGLMQVLQTAGTTSIEVLAPSATTFVKNVPVLFAINHDVADGLEGTTSDYEWRIPTTVTVTSSAGITGSRRWVLTVAAITNAYPKYALAIQPSVGYMRYTSLGCGDNRTRQIGVRPQTEAPSTAAAITLISTHTASVTISVSIASVTNAQHACYADIYVFNSQASAIMGPKPNQVPDSENNAFNGTTVVTGIGLTTYGGGTPGGGGALATATHYWIVAIIKEKNVPWDNTFSVPSTPVHVLTS